MIDLKNYDYLIKSDHELDIIREGGLIISKIFKDLSSFVDIGRSTLDVDLKAQNLCKQYNVKPAFLGYNGFPYSICANVNDTVVHGLPSNYKLKNGDIFGLDFGIVYKGFYLDMSYTFILGHVDYQVLEFVDKTKKSLYQGIMACKPGNYIGDISEAMRSNIVGSKFRLMKDFVGHGIGRNLHEPPQIPGEGLNKRQGLKIKRGMVFAVESISVMSSSNDYYILDDNWTVKTKDNSLSALFESTVIVTDNGPEIVTSFW